MVKDRSSLWPHLTGIRATVPVEWSAFPGLMPYPEAVEMMEERAAAIAAGAAREAVWLLEHPPLYTAGTSARAEDLLDPHRLPVFETGRGGRYTYHGPGQRIVYLMLDLSRRRRDIRLYVGALEEMVIAALAAFAVAGERRPDRVGVWVRRPGLGPGAEEDKIAAVGVRVRRWVTFHGVSVNIAPSLDDYAGIVPCGIAGHGVTSLAALGRPVGMDAFDAALRAAFESVFGPTADVMTPAPAAAAEI